MKKENPEALIAEKAEELLGVIKEALDKANNEAEFRRPVDNFIESFAKTLTLTPRLESERTLVGGRADAVFNRLVIEYEPPRSLFPNNDRRTNQHAIGQVKGYISSLSTRERQAIDSLAGVVLDGALFIFIRYHEGSWKVDEPVSVDADSCEFFLKTLRSLATERSLTESNLVKDFGENRPFTTRCVPALYRALVSELAREGNNRTKALYEQWVTMFQEVCNYQEGKKNWRFT